MFPEPDRHHSPMTEHPGGLEAEHDKIIPTQVPDDLARVKPVKDLRPVKWDKGFGVHDFDKRPGRSQSSKPHPLPTPGHSQRDGHGLGQMPGDFEI
jgi:hypothetical protein